MSLKNMSRNILGTCNRDTNLTTYSNTYSTHILMHIPGLS